ASTRPPPPLCLGRRCWSCRRAPGGRADCKTGAGDLSKSIAAAEDKIPMLETQLKAGSEAKVQSDDAAKEAKTDRADAKDAMAEATAVREKQAADFASLEAEYTANIGAIAKAVAALEKGMG
ncbi:unnamed protein product, partial [Prorocentrum cordatum]